MSRTTVWLETESAVYEDLTKQMQRKIEKHGSGAYHGPHESLGIITEEYYELIEAVKDNDAEAVRAELMDVAVAALWAIASLDTLNPEVRRITKSREKQEKKEEMNAIR